MSGENSNSWLKRFFKIFLFSPVNMVFIVALLWFAAKAYILEPSFSNKIIVYAILGLWIFWIIARYMIILFVALALLAGGYYAYYQYSHREQRKCEETGGYWNEKTNTCEAKRTILEKIDTFIKEQMEIYFPTKKNNEDKKETAE